MFYFKHLLSPNDSIDNNVDSADNGNNVDFLLALYLVIVRSVYLIGFDLVKD